MAGTADPIVTPNSGNVWLEGILWGTEWDSGGAAGSPTQVSVYIGGLHGAETITLDGQTVTATTPYTQELQAMLGAQEAMEAVCNIQFLNTSSQANADIIWASVNDADAQGALGWANPPGTAFSTPNNDEQSVIVANYEAYSPGFPDPNLLIPGGFDFITFIHELGHAIGLAHPHDTGGGSTIFPGVSGPFGDFGDFDMNQGVYTMMSYNDGWQTGPAGLPPGTTFGFEKGPMALDIAALQRMYGANMSYHAGADTYALPTADVAGTGYLCIWDAGGVDKIVGGDFGNMIDLRAATLNVGPGGGGWVSYATGIHGGFTIANGVVIENAVGGDGDDQIIGNGAGNRMAGEGGRDTLLGYSGADHLAGGDDNDVARGGTGADVLRGGDGVDTLVGEADADSLYGNEGDDRLTGGAGQDWMRGGEGADDFIFGALADSAIDGTRDQIDAFQRGADDIVVNAIDAIAGGADDAFVLDTGGTFAAGEIKQVVSGANIILQFNVDADVAAEMTVLLIGITTPLAASDFVL